MKENSPSSSVGAYYPWLDCLRGLSWVLVMIGHTAPYGYLARMGVGIFFGISGWLITQIILKQTETNWSLKNFYTRRCLRILPLFYFVIVVASLASFLLPHWKSIFPFLPPDRNEHQMWSYLFSFSTEFWRGGGGCHVIGHCWSLCVEERFYVFWPLILTLWPSHKNARRALIFFMIVVWAVALRRLSCGEITIALWAMPFPLLMGCALAIFFPKARFAFSKYAMLAIAAIIFGIYLFYAVGKEMISPTVGTFSMKAGLMAMALVACAIWTAGEPRNILFRLMQELGKLSYAAYLIHPIFAFIAIAVAKKIGYVWVGPVLGVAMCAPVAYMIHRWIEVPILNSRSRVERSTWGTYLCACLQVIPISIGIIFIFPWNSLGLEIRALPNLFPVLGLVAIWIITAWVCNNRKTDPIPCT